MAIHKAAFGLLLLIGLALVPEPSLGQSLQQGDRVRVTVLVRSYPSRLEGLVNRLTRDSLSVSDRSGQLQSWPWESVTLLERPVGRRGHAGTGALVGGAVGLAVGAFAGATAHRESQFIEVDTGGAVLIAAVVTGVGAGLGAIIGSTVRSDRWLAQRPEVVRPPATDP